MLKAQSRHSSRHNDVVEKDIFKDDRLQLTESSFKLLNQWKFVRNLLMSFGSGHTSSSTIHAQNKASSSRMDDLRFIACRFDIVGIIDAI
ncbi:hypothetical protein CEXT_794621 [Caerostris extrusa]|uniref:Uncharacterized protein n=1 Tax=Caerostris extrusa TaxID=172846 RepID=A0AAV4TNK0_CAEEX|nr:hypothetical protein CEXT_794621 [Caerostris extrusa]